MRTRRPRPILAVYSNPRGVFKKGKATTVANSVIAAVRTLVLENQRHVRVRITNRRGQLEARVMRGSRDITVLV